MYIRDDANIGPVPPVAIVGAALRFPGAADPASFHELTIAGRRMFRELAEAVPGHGQAGGHGPLLPLAFPPLRAALLDHEDIAHGGEPAAGTSKAGIAPRHALAAETVAAALADAPPSARPATPDRIGAIVADTPEPGVRHAGDWVREHLGLGGTAAAGNGTATPGPGPGRIARLRRAASGKGSANGSGTGDAAGAANGTDGPRKTHEAGGASAADGPTEADRAGRASGTRGPGGTDGARDANGASGTDSADTTGGASPTSSANQTRGGEDGGLHCSLRAIVAACEALNAGEFDLVVAGGVSTGVEHGRMTDEMPADPPHGEMRVYDAAPSGALPGEGCGVVALMRAADAQAAGLPVYAEIVGWHAADGDGQLSLDPAYARAGVDPADVQLLEGHGAASAAEDLAELSALLDLLGPRARCALGAVSAIIGDTRGAAGVAALLKAALAMTAGIIPPATGCVRPHPLLAAEPTPLRLPAAAEPWPETAVQLAAVNSLGTVAHPGAPRSGAAHVVLRRERDAGYPAGRRRRAASGAHAAQPPSSSRAPRARDAARGEGEAGAGPTVRSG